MRSQRWSRAPNSASRLADLVVNAAVFTDVDLAEGEPDACFAVNAEAPRTIAASLASWYDFGLAIAEEAAALGLIGRLPDVVPVPAAAFPAIARRPAWSVLDKSATWELLGGSAPHWRVALRPMLGQKAARG